MSNESTLQQKIKESTHYTMTPTTRIKVTINIRCNAKFHIYINTHIYLVIKRISIHWLRPFQLSYFETKEKLHRIAHFILCVFSFFFVFLYCWFLFFFLIFVIIVPIWKKKSHICIRSPFFLTVWLTIQNENKVIFGVFSVCAFT